MPEVNDSAEPHQPIDRVDEPHSYLVVRPLGRAPTGRDELPRRAVESACVNNGRRLTPFHRLKIDPPFDESAGVWLGDLCSGGGSRDRVGGRVGLTGRVGCWWWLAAAPGLVWLGWRCWCASVGGARARRVGGCGEARPERVGGRRGRGIVAVGAGGSVGVVVAVVRVGGAKRKVTALAGMARMVMRRCRRWGCGPGRGL